MYPEMTVGGFFPGTVIRAPDSGSGKWRGLAFSAPRKSTVSSKVEFPAEYLFEDNALVSCRNAEYLDLQGQ